MGGVSPKQPHLLTLAELALEDERLFIADIKQEALIEVKQAIIDVLERYIDWWRGIRIVGKPLMTDMARDVH